jgi:hypothetical protein
MFISDYYTIKDMKFKGRVSGTHFNRREILILSEGVYLGLGDTAMFKKDRIVS